MAPSVRASPSCACAVGGAGCAAEDGGAGSEPTVDGSSTDEGERAVDQLDLQLDSAGAPLPDPDALGAWLQDLRDGGYGNPHSGGAAGGRAAETIASARRLALRFFGADEEEYALVFTAGATAALRLVGEAFAWAPGADFACTLEAHNSLLGIRGYALAAGAAFRPVPYVVAAAAAAAAGGEAGEVGPGPPSLFAYPGECNFDGSLFDPRLAAAARRGAFTAGPGPVYVLLDAARLAATAPLRLSRLPPAQRPDFVAVSFYKIFGFPTGLGALLVRRGAERALRRRYFGGGAVAAAAAEEAWEARRGGPEALLEEGTPPYQLAAALRHAAAALEARGGIEAVCGRARALAAEAAAGAAALRHANGAPACEVYIQPGAERGASVALNVRCPSGAWVPPAEVARTAARAGIALRAGVMCNPGACLTHFGLDAAAARAAVEAGRGCGGGDGERELGGELLAGRPAGAVRLSFGAASRPGDARAALAFLRRCFVPPPPAPRAALPPPSGPPAVAAMYVYPVKGAGGARVGRWPLGPGGLLHDRAWAVLDSSGRLLGPAALSRLRAAADRPARRLVLECPGLPPLRLPLAPGPGPARPAAVPGARCAAVDCGPEAAAWLASALGFPARLVRAVPKPPPAPPPPGLPEALAPPAAPRGVLARGAQAHPPPPSFANDAPLLVVTAESLAALAARLGPAAPADLAARFRPNLVLAGGGVPHAEDAWAALRLPSGARLAAARPCGRCGAVDVEPATGAARRAVYGALAAYRRCRETGRVTFGLLLAGPPAPCELAPGDPLVPEAPAACRRP